MAEEKDEVTTNGGISFDSEVEVGEGYPLKPGKEPQKCIFLGAKFTPDYEIQKGDKKGQKQPIIEYTFQSMKETQRKTTFRTWDPSGAEKPQEAWDRAKARFAQIYKAFTGKEVTKEMFAKVKGVASGFETFATLLNEGNEGKPVYMTKEGKPVPVWLIPVYWKNMVDLPLGKFIEKVRTNKEGIDAPPLIEVLESYNIERTAKPERKAPGAVGGGADDEFDGMDDLPM